MKNNLLVIAHNKTKLEELANFLSKDFELRALDFNKYVEFNLGRDEKFVIDNLGLEYYWNKYNKAFNELDDFEDSLVFTDMRICLNEEALQKALNDYYVVIIDIPTKEQEYEISKYLLSKPYLYKSTKTKLMKNFRYAKSKAEIVVKYVNTSEETVNKIVKRIMEDIKR